MSSDRFRISQTPLFGRKVKKFKKNEKETLDREVQRIMADPDIGAEKKGDLQGIRVHRYKFNSQELLLAYSVEEDEILLITIGSHENYYRDLKGYVK
ncbi:MAG: type II toxin-antitoxin system RelE/ParE family toxin [Opitutales bacterium]